MMFRICKVTVITIVFSLIIKAKYFFEFDWLLALVRKLSDAEPVPHRRRHSFIHVMVFALFLK
jgi:hypothetical protein